MTRNELEQYLHDHIPLSRAMQISVVDAQPKQITLGAPLAPNINHRETVFGGSSSAVAILAAWSLVHFRLHSEGLYPRLVIQRNTMNYDLPISGDFSARATLRDEASWEQFKRMLLRKGRARVAVNSVLEFDGEIAGRFEGEFVALSSDHG